MIDQYTTLNNSQPKVLIAFSNPLIASLFKYISADVSFEVIETLTDGSNLFERLLQLKPDYLVIDSDLRQCSGIGFLKKIKRIDMETKVIVYSNTISENYLKCFISSPAIAYIQNGCDEEELKKCMRSALGGNRVIHALTSFTDMVTKNTTKQYDFDVLTEREKEIWELILQAQTEREIANNLSVSVYTIKTHKSNISKKLGIKNKTRLTRLAGIV